MDALATFSVFTIFLIILTIWSLIWKGFGLWHSARDEKKVWFICILVLNTAGILPIIYLLLRRKKSKKRKR